MGTIKGTIAMGISPINSSLVNQFQNKINSSYGELSSGKKDRRKDPAGASIADRLDMLSRSLEQADRNIDASRGQVEFSLGGISSQQESLSKVKELTLQYKNTQSDEDKQIIKDQIDAEIANIDAAANQKFNGATPLNSDDSTTVQIGEGSSDTLTISSTDTSAQALGLSGFDPADADALDQLDAAAGDLNIAASQLASTENRLDFAQNAISHRVEASQAARSRIEDVDVAEAFAEKTKNEILQKGQIALIAQANTNSSTVFRLLGPKS